MCYFREPTIKNRINNSFTINIGCVRFELTIELTTRNIPIASRIIFFIPGHSDFFKADMKLKNEKRYKKNIIKKDRNPPRKIISIKILCAPE